MFYVKYDVVEEIYKAENTQRTAYGIAAYNAGGGVGDIVEVFHDISDNKQSVSALASKCNELELSIEHFEDVVADFLCE